MTDTSFIRNHTNEAVEQRGEVFTPEALVTEMLAKLPDDFFTSAEKTMLDNSCGNGNFLFKILQLRMANGVKHLDALTSIYGVEIDEKNAQECRERLSLGEKSAAIWKILKNNIICANALDEFHPGWDQVGYLWSGETYGRKEGRNYKETKKKLAEEKSIKKNKPIKISEAAEQFFD